MCNSIAFVHLYDIFKIPGKTSIFFLSVAV